MKVLNFTDDEISSILRILAALLHLGNVQYAGTLVDNIDASEIRNRDCLERVARLMQVRALQKEKMEKNRG